MRDSYDECWTDSEFMIVFLLCAKKENTSRDGFLYTHTQARSHRAYTRRHAHGKYHTRQPPPHQPVEWTIFFWLK